MTAFIKHRASIKRGIVSALALSVALSSVWPGAAALAEPAKGTDAATVAAGCATELPANDVAVPVDPAFTQPYVDVDEMRTSPVPHRYVHGGFKGTDTKFSFYFPPKDKYQGRFFQHVTPFAMSETLAQGQTGEMDDVSFAISSGGYYVETNGGGKGTIGDKPGGDSSIGAYRANAASAMYSRVLAEKMYGGKRPYGYIWGGSGGAYRSVGSIENTNGVWDGAVPHVMGSDMAVPNVFTVRAYAYRVLRNKFPQIVDALEPGGSGDPLAGLNDEEKAAFKEVSQMGFPEKSWYSYKKEDLQSLPVLFSAIKMMDSSYYKDFWTKPGYEGFNPPASLLSHRVHYTTTISKLLSQHEAHLAGLPIDDKQEAGTGSVDTTREAAAMRAKDLPAGVELADTPTGSLFIAEMTMKTGKSAGKTVVLAQNEGRDVLLAQSLQDLTPIINGIQPGDQVDIDNSDFLAIQTYHRHQVPGPEYAAWNQYRDASGKPIYPQRPMLLGPIFTAGAAGSVPTGNIHGKVILVESTYDREAYPWQADWYRQKVTEHLKGCTDNNFRIYYTDHAVHDDHGAPDDPDHIVSYQGELHQALRDLAAWVEKGTPPPASTNYKIIGGQVVLADQAKDRKGLQPVIALSVNGQVRADIKAGQTVTLSGRVDVPPGGGKVVSVEWDFEGHGTFVQAPKFTLLKDGSAKVMATYTYAKLGTYFPVLRATSQRNGDAKTVFARLPNLARARVVVQ